MTEYVTQNIRTVLKTFQSSAPKSLQGPGNALQASSHLNNDLAPPNNNNSNIAGNAPLHALSPCAAAAGAGEHCHQHSAANAASMSSSTTTAAENSAVLPSPVASLLIKKEIFSSPEPPSHYELNASPSITIVPPPPPELPQPILSAADSGSGELFETRLEGKTIGCYSLGGEMRLCLPQFLNNVLADFTLDQINRIFDELGIFCSQCTPDQLMEFKAAKILPSDVKACGLITRTDAERLCAALLHRSDRNIYISDAEIPKGAISFKVYHRCFGKCEGICTPDMYSYTKPTCIMCLECKGYFSPQKFVGHVHRKQENRTCHWGFDSRNWHDYLHVALDVENRDKYQKILDELKEVEYKEALKAQRDMSYLKRKAEMFLDEAMLGPTLGHSSLLVPHQPFISNCGAGKQQRDLLDIPSKKLKNLDEASAYQLAEYQRYQALLYAQCVQQQRIGQMSAFRPWAPPKSFLQVPYSNVAANLPYLSQEPPVLQNPERVVRSSDRERFERTYQPNVALAPRKSILTKEREKEQREREREREQREHRERERVRERERLDREQQRDRELEKVRERERSLERERERDRELREREREMRERDREIRERELQQQQQQIALSQCESELVHIKQERANTPAELPLSTSPSEDDEATGRAQLPLLSNHQQQPTLTYKSSNIDIFQLRHHNLHTPNSISSASSTSSTLSAHSALVCADSGASPQWQAAQFSPPSQTVSQRRLKYHQHQNHQPLQQQQTQHTPPSPPSAQSPEEFSGSNEISSSTSPLPPTTLYNQQHHLRQQQQIANNNSNNHHLQQQQQQSLQPLPQTIIATVNQHAKLLPTTANGSAVAAIAAGNGESHSRIRINKNLINQPNFMRSPTPPASQQQQQQQQLLQHQQQYEHYRQQQQQHQQHFYNQQQHQYQQHCHQQQLPSQAAPHSSMSSNCLSRVEARLTATGLNLSSNGGNAIVAAKQQLQQQQQQQHHNGVAAHTGSEFELSTDTDDDSVNGEPDSSNMLAPWELAVEALKDTRPKDRERILQLLQKLLQDNQQCRYDNIQLSAELRRREKQICDLKEQLQRYQQQQQQQLATLALGNQQNGSRDEVVQLPLKKSTRREPDLDSDVTSVITKQQLQHEQKLHYNGASVVTREREQQQQQQQQQLVAETDSEFDDSVMKSAEGEHNSDAKEADAATAVKQENDSENVGEKRATERVREARHNVVAVATAAAAAATAADKTEFTATGRQLQQYDDDGNSCTSDADSDDEEDKVVMAPHTSAAATPPTATTPMSPDSAATAGRLFDSSNSSDGESMKQAQMSASNALAKMAAERTDTEDAPDREELQIGDNNAVDDEGGADTDDGNNDDEDDEEDDEGVDDNANYNYGRADEGAKCFRNDATPTTPIATTTTTSTTNHAIQIKQELI